MPNEETKFPKIITENIIDIYFDYDFDETNWPYKISVTSLIDAPYLQYLKKIHSRHLKEKLKTDANFREKFAIKNWWLMFGKSVHGMLENLIYSTPNINIERSTEERNEIDIKINGIPNLITISGKYDFREWITDDCHDLVSDEITDFKVTSKYILTNDTRLRDYFWQLNLLRLIHGNTATKLTLILILRDLMPQDKYSNKFPDIPVVEKDVPIYAHETIMSFIDTRIKYHLDTAVNIEKGIINSCTTEERWGKPETFAVVKDEATTAYRVFENKNEAIDLANSKKGYHVEHRPAEDVRCDSYCDYNIFCPYYLSKGKKQ